MRRRGLGRPVAVATVFLALVAGLALLDRLPLAVPAASLVLSLMSFWLYASDKSAAQRHARRVPESTLHLIDLLGGWPGGLVARHAYRHKTRKQPFRTVFWCTVVANVAALGWLVVTGPRGPCRSHGSTRRWADPRREDPRSADGGSGPRSSCASATGACR